MPKPFNPQDKYFQRAKQQGYLARSVFKLEEIQARFKIIRKGNSILDLGAAPGSWLQYAAKIAGPTSKLVGVDLTAIKPLGQNIKTIQADIFSPELIEKIKALYPNKFDLILSDLAPKTSGIKETDHARSIELNRRVIGISDSLLKPRGTVILKVFQGGDFDKFLKELKRKFKMVKIFKPQASRGRSFEVYLICKK